MIPHLAAEDRNLWMPLQSLARRVETVLHRAFSFERRLYALLAYGHESDLYIPASRRLLGESKPNGLLCGICC